MGRGSWGPGDQRPQGWAGKGLAAGATVSRARAAGPHCAVGGRRGPSARTVGLGVQGFSSRSWEEFCLLSDSNKSAHRSQINAGPTLKPNLPSASFLCLGGSATCTPAHGGGFSALLGPRRLPHPGTPWMALSGLTARQRGVGTPSSLSGKFLVWRKSSPRQPFQSTAQR